MGGAAASSQGKKSASRMKNIGKFFFGTVALVICLYFVVQMVYRPVGQNKEKDVPQMQTLALASLRRNDGSVPNVNLKNLKHSNETANFVSELQRKYGPVEYSGVSAVSTTLTPEEDERYRTCVKNGPHDRAVNGSKFWGKAEHIRRTHHTYLKNENAVLLEIGGNQGNDASEFVKLYNPRYIILEPLEEYANILKKKFTDNPRVTVVNLGLGEKNEVVMVKIEGNNACATSRFSGAGGETPLYITNATEFLMKIGLGVFDVDLMTMNCEGCEFEALEAILRSSLVKHLRNIQWATHSTITGLPNPIERYCKIQQLLSRTHRPTYQYRFIWESWRRKDLQ